MRYGELKRLLQKSGCRMLREGSNHELWESPLTGKVFPVSRHSSQEVNVKTLYSIVKQSGIKL